MVHLIFLFRPQQLLAVVCLEVNRERLLQLSALLVLPVPVNQAYKVSGVSPTGNECFNDALETLGNDTAQTTA